MAAGDLYEDFNRIFKVAIANCEVQCVLQNTIPPTKTFGHVDLC